MQQQWGCFINRVLNKFKRQWVDKNAYPLLPLPYVNKNLNGKKYFIGCHKQTASGMNKYTLRPPADIAHGRWSEENRCQQFSHYG